MVVCVCVCGDHQNRTVLRVAEPELACPPVVDPVGMQLESEAGRNISFRCRVSGIVHNTVQYTDKPVSPLLH